MTMPLEVLRQSARGYVILRRYEARPATGEPTDLVETDKSFEVPARRRAAEEQETATVTRAGTWTAEVRGSIAVDTVFEGKRKIKPDDANSNCFDP
jgi:hypothetical protein